ncbi:MAG: class I adenylate-forming enzyme family protein [Acidocella sp.]|nr:class I adenylate-forming enzyme family protein [Acidocella sp.]
MKTSWQNISDALFHHAGLNPDRVALTDGTLVFSYRQLAQRVAQASVYLKNLGIKPGFHVGLVMGNNAPHIILTLAVMRVGAVLVELPTDITMPELTVRISRFNIVASFLDPDAPSSSAPLAIRIGPGWLDDIAELAGDARAETAAEALQIIILSSGSTGSPKGLVTTQRQRMLRAETWWAQVGEGWTEAEPCTLTLLASPALSMFAQCLVIQILLGGTIVLLPKYQTSQALVQAIQSYENTICPVVPGIVRGFLDCAPAEGVLFPKMRALVCAGLPLTGHEKQALVSRVTPHAHEIYGSGGFGAFAHLGPQDIATHKNSCGRPVVSSGNVIELVGADDKPVAVGVEGRLRVRGPNVSVGFFNAEDNQRGAETFSDGWYYPGDVLLEDSAGYFYLRGRSDDAFAAGELTVYPQEIEDIITRHPDIDEAIIVGRPDGNGLVELVGFLVVRNGLDHEAVVAHCMTNLPPMKRPVAVRYIEALPRTGNGKIDRPALKQAALNLATRQS